MTFGQDWGFGSTPEESAEILDRYFDLGGNFIDTANVYTKGHSEKIIGEHLGKSAGRRQRSVIATKFFGSMLTGDPNSGGSGRKAVAAACEESLRRLQTDYIDLYWMHCWDKNTPIEETMRALDDLVAAGKVRYIGFSDTPAWKALEAQMIAKFRGWTPLIALQLEYSLLERTIEGELVPMALEHGLGITPLTEKAYTVIDELGAIAKDLESTPARVALSWLQSRPGVASTIIGARTLKQLEDNLAALEVKLKPEHADRLTALTKPALNFPYDFLTRAGTFSSSGTTVNGMAAGVNPLAPTNESDRY
jgi:aryl-alcohol dehydrogenase-like predicted oxidoreductase